MKKTLLSNGYTEEQYQALLKAAQAAEKQKNLENFNGEWWNWQD
jgi:hypothetical protein